MSIIPGMESRAPDRTATSNGMALVSPKVVPIICSIRRIPSSTSACIVLGISAVMCVKVSADFGRNREARRDRQTDPCHFGQVRAFAAEQRLHLSVPIGLTLAEVINKLRRFGFRSRAFRLVRREAEDFRAMNDEMGERARQSNSPTGRVNAQALSAVRSSES